MADSSGGEGGIRGGRKVEQQMVNSFREQRVRTEKMKIHAIEDDREK